MLQQIPKWLMAYDGKIGSVSELSALVRRLTESANRERNSALGVPPCIEFAKEKEHLSPLPPEALLREFESWSHSCIVPQTQLVYFHGARYSVPPNYITKSVQIEEDAGRVYIYHGGRVVASHDASPGNNYDEAHLRAGLSASVGGSEEIDDYIGRTMSRFKGVGA